MFSLFPSLFLSCCYCCFSVFFSFRFIASQSTARCLVFSFLSLFLWFPVRVYPSLTSSVYPFKNSLIPSVFFLSLSLYIFVYLPFSLSLPVYYSTRHCSICDFLFVSLKRTIRFFSLCTFDEAEGKANRNIVSLVVYLYKQTTSMWRFFACIVYSLSKQVSRTGFLLFFLFLSIRLLVNFRASFLLVCGFLFSVCARVFCFLGKKKRRWKRTAFHLLQSDSFITDRWNNRARTNRAIAEASERCRCR